MPKSQVYLMPGPLLQVALAAYFTAGGTTASAVEKYPPKPTAADFAESDKAFTYRGKPIDPGLVAQFQGWESDSGLPVTVAVDVAACFDTNQCAGSDIKAEKDGRVVRKGGGDDLIYSGYKWLGRLHNGTHVLETFSGGGGSALTETIILAHFEKGKGYYQDGEAYDRLMLMVDRTYELGDHVDVIAKLDKDTVHLTVASTAGEKTPAHTVDLISKR